MSGLAKRAENTVTQCDMQIYVIVKQLAEVVENIISVLFN